MFKKMVVGSALALMLLGSGDLFTEKASAASLSVTPSSQTIRNALATAQWQLSWSGTPKYDVAVKPSASLSWRTINSATNLTSRSYSYRYDLGSAATATYNVQFSVSDLHSVVFRSATVNHYRSN